MQVKSQFLSVSKILSYYGWRIIWIYVLHVPLGALLQGLLSRGFSVKVEDSAPYSGFLFMFGLVVFCEFHFSVF